MELNLDNYEIGFQWNASQKKGVVGVEIVVLMIDEKNNCVEYVNEKKKASRNDTVNFFESAWPEIGLNLSKVSDNVEKIYFVMHVRYAGFGASKSFINIKNKCLKLKYLGEIIKEFTADEKIDSDTIHMSSMYRENFKWFFKTEGISKESFFTIYDIKF